MPKVKILLPTVMLFVALTLAATAAVAQSDLPAAKVSLETTSIAAGVGFSLGNGKLRFNGKEYGFSIDGVTLIDVGVSKASAAGDVYHLADLAKFEGHYVAAEASIALGGGVGGISLRNSNGVVMHLNSVSQGARLQLGSSGMSIKLSLPPRKS
ncbi:MAG: DUF1134 domain-containing protein [Candidatus Binatia bacterium]